MPKRLGSCRVEAPGKNQGENSKPATATINLSGNPNSCLVKLGRTNFRALVDSGAEVSLLHQRAFNQIKNKPKLKKTKLCLQSVSGESLGVLGTAIVNISVGGEVRDHEFVIVSEMNRNMILGMDWLVQNKVNLYFGLGKLKIGSTYVSLEKDIHIASLVRVAADTVLKPQTATICRVKIKENLRYKNKNCHIDSVEGGYLSLEPGVIVHSSVGKVENKSVPVLISNNTGKTIKLRRGCVIGRSCMVEEAKEIGEVRVKGEKSEREISPDDVHAPPEHKNRLVDIFKRHRDRVADTDCDLGRTPFRKAKIEMKENAPPYVSLKPYRTPLNQRRTIEESIEKMLKAKVIQKSNSPWSFPVVLAEKADGSKRFCCDFRQLNKLIKPISYPLPLIDDILALLSKAKYYSAIDLKSGYWQVELDEESKEKTAFVCHKGLYHWNVLPFGICTAPAIFSELMATVLEGFEHFAIAYIDDILIFSESAEAHFSHIEKVLDRLREHNLKLKLPKCRFAQKETEYLGFTVSAEGVKPQEKKVEAIKSMARPTCVKEVRSLVGMCSYYRRFIPNFSKIVEPIVALTRKFARFKWSPECENAFEFLKASLSVVPLLAYPDLSKPYVLYTDASDTCIGACLTQEFENEDGSGVVEKPLYFLSHKLSDTQTRWSTIEKEAFAIHFALSKLNHFLHGAQFVIKTDHQPLKYLLESPIKNKKIAMWALGISGYNCSIQYLPGKDNVLADLLSRVPEGSGNEVHPETDPNDVSDNAFRVQAINSNRFDPKTFATCPGLEKGVEKNAETEFQNFDMKQEQQKDPTVLYIRKQLKAEDGLKSVKKRHVVINELLYFISDPDDEPLVRLYIPSHLQTHVIQQYHDGNGHMGIDKTFETAKAKYYFPNMYQRIAEHIDVCVICKTRMLKKQKAPVQETENSPYPFAKLGFDLSGPYPKSLSGNTYIASFVDHFGGWPEAFAIPDKSAPTVAHLLYEEIFPRFSCPLQMVTDNGSENVNQIMNEVCKELNIDHITTSFYHPQSNSKVERWHRTLHDILSKKIEEEGDVRLWDVNLNQTLAAVRMSVSESTGYSPFFLLYHRDPVLPLDNILRPRRKYTGEEHHRIALEEQHKVFTKVHRRLEKAKKRQLKYANRDVKPIEIKVGDAVYYKRHNTRKDQAYQSQVIRKKLKSCLIFP